MVTTTRELAVLLLQAIAVLLTVWWGMASR